MALGDIGTAIGEESYFTGTGTVTDYLDAKRLAGNIYVSVFSAVTGVGDLNGYLVTSMIETDGTITTPSIDTEIYDTASPGGADLQVIDDNLVAIIYTETGRVLVNTYEIDDDGIITAGALDTLEVLASGSGSPVLHAVTHVDGDVYAVFYNESGTPTIGTFSVSSLGILALIDNETLSNTIGSGRTSGLVHVEGDIFLACWKDTSSDGWVGSVEITTAGVIGSDFIETLEFEPSTTVDDMAAILIGPNVVACFYDRSGTPRTSTINVDSDGTGLVAIDALNGPSLADADMIYPVRLSIDKEAYVITAQVTGNDGFVWTINITDAGDIGPGSSLDTLEYRTGTVQGAAPVVVGADVVGIFFEEFVTEYIIQTLPIEGAAFAVASAVVTGTLIGSNEEGIRDGGKTIIITLSGATWHANVGTNDASTTALIAGIDSNLAEEHGWDAAIANNLTFNNVVRTSNTVVTITMPSLTQYVITESEIITITVPDAAMA